MKTFYAKIKRIVTAIICFAMIATSLSLTACGIGKGGKKHVEDFYNAVVKSQELLDIVADDIYRNWYDYIYEDAYSSIDMAILYAQIDNAENLEAIEANETTIHDLYKKAKDSDLEDEVKEVMSAYSDYYEFVVNVSGSFETYRRDKETYKKALASALKKLSLEL